MALSTWWAGDPFLDLTPLSDFHVQAADDDTLLASLNRISVDEVQARKQAGHRPYIGSFGTQAVTYGWSAARRASIGELSLDFGLPSGDRYLWDFATLPEWQGKGLYPRLLQGIVQAEEAERFWIIYAPENMPSGAGIQKAGFQPVGQLSFLPDGRVGLIPLERPERANIGASLLGVPLLEDGLSPCWRCMDEVICTCQLDPEQCDCAIEIRPRSEVQHN
jgi:GNAT superfamily N-acetyltransferase